MPRIEIELDDKGEILGKTPSEIDALFKRVETTSYGIGLKKGREDASVESAKQIEDRLKAEREAWEKENPVGRVKELEEENLRFRESEAQLAKRYSDTARAREEQHAKEMADRAEAITKRDSRLRESLAATIRAEAIASGAREESLTELEVLLASRVSRDQEFLPVVMGEDGKPALVHGKPLTIGAFVKTYLDAHPHHRKPAGGQGGGARGGASFQRQGGDVSEDVARARIDAGDKSPTAIDALFQATRKQKAS